MSSTKSGLILATKLARFCIQYPPLGGRGYGDSKMREYQYVACPCCGETMQLARTAFHAELPLETFECKPCGVTVTAEAVSGTHVLIEKVTTIRPEPH